MLAGTKKKKSPKKKEPVQEVVEEIEDAEQKHILLVYGASPI